MLKKIKEIFETLGLKITIEPNLTKVDFLDVTFNLETESFQPFRKPNDTPTYIHKDSNHPPHIKKNLPTAINKRLSEISSNEQLFNENKQPYEDALKKSGLKNNLKFQNHQNNGRKRNRPRKQIWFTPPYNATLKTNIGKEFLKLIDKHFPKNKPLSKIFNRKTIKIGYSCTNNMNKIITSHNKRILNDKQEKENTVCNCRKPTSCPVNNKCQTKNVVYKATLKNGVNYIGMTSTTFKTRYNNHIHSFKTEAKKNSTTLSQYIWRNNLQPEPDIK